MCFLFFWWEKLLLQNTNKLYWNRNTAQEIIILQSITKNFHLKLQADQTHTCWAGEQAELDKCVRAIILAEFLK